MKQKAIDFEKKHQEEIQAISDIIKEIAPKLEALKANHPDIGYMLYLGIDEQKSYWIRSLLDIHKKLAGGIIRDILQEQEDLRAWVLERIDVIACGRYIQHHDQSESEKVKK